MKPSRLTLLMPALLSLSLHAGEPGNNARDLIPLLHTMKSDAIEIGEGSTDAYVFVDPKCLKSRDFLDTITTNATLRKRFHYYIFLYDMPEVDSKNVINAVYGDKVPKEAMFTYMLKRQRISRQTDETPLEAQKKIRRIEEAAGEIGIKRTPFMIVDREP